MGLRLQRFPAAVGLMAVAAVALGAHRASLAQTAPLSGSAALVLRMSTAMAWPDRFVALVEVSAPAQEASGPARASGGSPGPVLARVRLSGFPPDLFAWQPEGDASEPPSGVAYRGWVHKQVEGPGPRFAYSYAGLPFLDALRVYFGVFRPLPERSRLVMGRMISFLGREAAEATLVETETGQRASLVIDTATGLVLEAVTQGAAPVRLVRAVQLGGAPELRRIEYEVPVLGSSGRMVLERVRNRWFLREAVVGDGAARQVRFLQLQLGDEAGALARPQADELVRLRELDEQAATAFARGQYREALALYAEIRKMDPYNAEARERLGYAAMELGDWLTAASEFQQVIHLAPHSPTGYLRLADLYVRFRLSSGKAVELARKAVELAGERVDATILDTYGWALLHDGQVEPAIQALERAVALSGDNPRIQAEILYHLGVAKLRQSRVEEARQLLSRALELDPGLREAREALGRMQSGGSL